MTASTPAENPPPSPSPAAPRAFLLAAGVVLEIGIDLKRRPWARFRAADGRLLYRASNDNRAHLLQLLASQVVDDLAAGQRTEDAGWYHDERLLPALWGRAGSANRIHVLIYRLRQNFLGAGIRPGLLVRRRLRLRLQVERVLR